MIILLSLFPDLKFNKFQLDLKSKVTPVMQQWFHLKSKYPDCILFFRMGDFYELFFEDAKITAPILDLKLTSRGIYNDKPIPLAGIPVKSLNEYLQKIIYKNLPVAVVEQAEEPIKIKSKEFYPRDVTQVITPGTILNPDLLSSHSNNYLVVINYKDKKDWGWSICDVTTGEFNISKFSTFQSMLNEVFKIQPAEIITNIYCNKIKDFSAELEKLFPNVHSTTFEGDFFDFDEASQLLKDFFNVNSLEGFGINETEYYVGISAAGALLKILEHRKIPFIASKVKKIEIYGNHDFLEIDPIARKNLELEVNLRDGGLQGTLLSIMDQTNTPMGARTLRSWFRKPLIDKTQIMNRLDIVKLFFKEFTLRQDLISCLQQITDLERLCTKIYYKGAIPRDLKRLEDSLLQLPFIKNHFKQLHKIESVSLINLLSKITELPEVISLINSAIDMNSSDLQDGGFIKSKYNFELDKLRDFSKNSKEYLQEFEKKEQENMDKLAKQKNIKSTKIKVAYTRGHGYYIEAKNTGIVPEEYSISRSLKDRTRYTTPELLKLASTILSAEEDIKNLELKIYKNLLSELEQFIPKIQIISKNLSELDVLLTFSHISNAYNYVCPEISESINIDIVNGRHPIVEQILNMGEFIPNNTILNNTNDILLIISGANMGGKSTYLRQVALITIMTQLGCFVPADKALIGIVDRIFTRVGIVDDIWKGQSHFMIEMIETASVLNNATPKSLVLLDEIGRGTSTNTGLSIAWAVSKYLHEQVKCRTLFATHYHQLNEMEKKFFGINNYHMSVYYDIESSQLRFLRKIEKGGTDESYGLEVAELAGFPQTVIQDARKTRELIDNEQFFQSFRDKINTNSKSKITNSKLEEENQSQKVKPKKSPKMNLFSFIQPKFSLEIENMLKNIDIDLLTPIEALNILHDLKKKLKT